MCISKIWENLEKLSLKSDGFLYVMHNKTTYKE